MAAMAPEPLLIAFLSVVVASAAAPDGLVDFPLPLEATKNLGTISKLPPWVVVVNVCGEPNSVGARISSRWVLSDALFTLGHSKDQFTISTDWDSKTPGLQVDKVVTHNKYLLDWRYSVTLLRTKEDMTGGELIKLPNSAPKSDSKLNVYGWDTFSETIIPKTVETVVQDHSTCRQLSNPAPSKDLQLCVGTVGVLMPCYVKTGGLVVENNSVLVGIIPIYSARCNVNALHTSVAGFSKWIKTTTSV